MSPPTPLKSSKDAPQTCVWMQAGVVRRKYCPHDYQCASCRYDRVLHRTAKENRRLRAQGIRGSSKRAGIVSWKEKLKERSPAMRPCLHHMKARIDFRACTNAYRCSDCEFDQYFDEQFSVYAAMVPIDLVDIAGFKFPQGIYLHPGHTWVKLEEDNSIRIGLDEFIFRTLGPLDGISPPLLGKRVYKDRPEITLSRGTADAKVLAPISGVVTATNPRLSKISNAGTKDAYTDSWILRIHTEDLRRELKTLMMGAETEEFMSGEVDRLYGVIEAAAGPLAADGGRPSEDICGKLPQLDWKRLARLFLRT